jgi:predicted GIY-YIG superfamily endonuclease
MQVYLRIAIPSFATEELNMQNSVFQTNCHETYNKETSIFKFKCCFYMLSKQKNLFHIGISTTLKRRKDKHGGSLCFKYELVEGTITASFYILVFNYKTTTFFYKT